MGYFRLQNYEKAIDLFKISKEFAETESQKHYSTYWLGFTYYKFKLMGEAKLYFKESLKYKDNKGNESNANYYLAEILYKEKDYINAKKYIEDSILISTDQLSEKLKQDIEEKLTEEK